MSTTETEGRGDGPIAGPIAAAHSTTDAAHRSTDRRAPRPSPRTTVLRHLRAALVGTLLAIVAITALSAYAAQGIADARSNALCRARITCP